MFWVFLQLSSEYLFGLDALDTRRELGLPDDTQLFFADDIVRVEVSEEFARKYFKRDECSRRIILRFQDFTNGDLIPHYDTNKVKFNPDMSQQRRMELILKNWSRSK